MRRMPRSVVGGLLLVVVVGAGGGVGHAQDGAAFVAPSARAAGRAGVRLAGGADATVIDRNPALLATLSASRADLTGIAYATGLAADTSFGDSETRGGPWQVGGSLALAWRPDPTPQGRWTIGLGVLPQGGFRTNLQVPVALYPQGTPHRSDFLYSSIFGAMAWEVLPTLALGASVALERGDLSLRSPTEQPTSLFQGVFPFLPDLTWEDFFKNGDLDTFVARVKLETETDPGVSFRLGSAWTPVPWLRLGAFWKPPSYLPEYEGRGTIDTQAQFGPIDDFFVQQYGQSVFPDGFVGSYDVSVDALEMPQMAGLGGTLRLGDRLEVGADVTWIGWSRTFDELRVDLRHGDNPGFNDIVGSDSLTAVTPLHWRDQIVAAVGSEWAMGGGWRLRGGYRYARSPVPANALDPIAPAILEHSAALGLGWAGARWSVDAAWMHFFPARERSPTNAILSDYGGLRQTFRLDTLLLQAGVRF